MTQTRIHLLIPIQGYTKRGVLHAPPTSIFGNVQDKQDTDFP
jgi:hypothetical protein